VKKTICVFRIDFESKQSIKGNGSTHEVGEFKFFLLPSADRHSVAVQLRHCLKLIEGGDELAGAGAGN
jgi:hypothetical protein